MKPYRIKNSLARLVICLVLAIGIFAGFAGNAHAAIPYEVDISLDRDTRAFLKSQGYSLYAFKGIDAGKGAASTVWFELTGDQELYNQPLIEIKWQEDYYIGETTTAIKSGAQVIGTSPYVDPSNVKSVDVGEVYIYEGVNWDANPKPSINPDSFEILNQPKLVDNFYVSQSNSVNSKAADSYIVVQELPGAGGLGDFKPIETVSFIFTTRPVKRGTIIVTAFTPGIIATVPNDGVPLPLTYTPSGGWSGPSGNTQTLEFGDDIYEAMLSAAP
ncbi:MAG: hypothetical protein J7647_10165 [Cyanobacteria bacterium SBLK]|nr:hypothetical protein [Cyanobacteria bacterium SBLK]